MSDSWRAILERAAENLSVDLDQIAAPAFSHAQAASYAPRRLSPQLSFAESRELLARELQAFSHEQTSRPTRPRWETATALTVPVAAPKQKRAPARNPRKRGALQNLMATVLSAALTGGLAAYFLLAHGQFGESGATAFEAYASSNVSAASAGPASVASAGVVNRATEDALMDRASYQLAYGDGESGRAVYEILADHGSVRGAFALAETYDPAMLAQHPSWKLTADIRLARLWYKKAAGLGSLSASERLRALDQRASLPGKAARL